ncbi:MAG: DUF4377 domain-containing protein, partial [Deltaproteobacteria bacterium]|nr:DUF4377 domain-containing protein [Deltaproteobacteria bacterium]
MGASCDDELETETQSQKETQTLFVNSERVSCTGVAPMQCMQVKEHEEDDWSLFYDSIEGFEYEAGYVYELVVE